MISTVIFLCGGTFDTGYVQYSDDPRIYADWPLYCRKIGVSPYPIAMIITLAGAASYATPFAAPQNMMTVGWTKYKFMDFVKIGVPMVLLYLCGRRGPDSHFPSILADRRHEMKELLNGAWDLHFHTAPDVVPRKYTDLELAEEMERRRYEGRRNQAPLCRYHRPGCNASFAFPGT